MSEALGAIRADQDTSLVLPTSSYAEADGEILSPFCKVEGKSYSDLIWRT